MNVQRNAMVLIALMQSNSMPNGTFLRGFLPTLAISGLCIAWQLGIFSSIIYSLPRPTPTFSEYLFATILVVLLSTNVGLLFWQKQYGSCPVGTKRASGIASALGAFALICPACVLLPFSLFGLSVVLSSLSVYIPMLQIISIILLVVSTILLWPKK
jgi:hypothetical protein